MIGDIKNKATISGNIKVDTKLSGTVKAFSIIGKAEVGTAKAFSIIGKAEVGTVVVKKEELPEYDGMYEVTPNTNEQTLDTANKRMEENLKINAIPYFDVSNEYGRTIYIGGDPNA